MSPAKNPSEPASAAADQPTFEQALTELEAIVHRLEEGELDLANALQQYEQGVKHLRQCYEMLDVAERKIELLTGVDAQGNAITEPFAEERMGLEEQAGRRRRTSPTRRPAANRPAAGDVDDPDAVF